MRADCQPERNPEMHNSEKAATVGTDGQHHGGDHLESVFTGLEPQHPGLTGARTGPDVYRRAKLLAAFVLVSMLGTNAWLIHEARQNELDQAIIGNTNLVRAVAERVEGSIAEAEHILDSLVYELERSELTADALERLQPILVNHVSNVEQLKGLFVYDAVGDWIATSEASWDKSLNNSDRAYFIHHRESPSARALVSAPVVSRSSGEWIVPVSRRLVDANGKFAGVALATVSIKHLRALLERFDVGEHGAITLSVSGRILVRRPYVEAELGKPAPVSAFSALAASQRFGNTMGRSPIDGVERLVSFEHTRNFPIRVSVATSKDDVLRKWWVASCVQTVWVAFLCGVLWVAGVYFKRSMRYRVKAEAGMREARDALAQANARLAHMAQYDGLTGLPNRRFFDRRLARYTPAGAA